MAQLSFYSAEANRPQTGDLAGLLCCQGQLAEFARTAARLSLSLADRWRVRALRLALAERRVDATHTVTEEGVHGLRTAFRADLLPLAEEWTKEGEKFAPTGLTLDGGALRLWVLAAGDWLGTSYFLGLDPEAPDTYDTVRGALGNAGLPATLQGTGLRISGRRRLGRLAELVGRPPSGDAEEHWPAVSGMRRSA
ncbi:hypothetical protein [Actinophytocola oryzae]|uniref:Uncharacterized protein n=1 Tax=Actinophytocola oryzae TaxID=502181 RepID=A0A4R7UX27_9PSEU|nr:hypothetical protein [Actinophytocola oryzae]TDV40674.1 hypothetical protein CLV71_12263 [Actinophytocola oryzae]